MFRVSGLTFIPDGLVKAPLLQKAEEEDMSDDEESYELVDSLPRTKALTPHDMAVLEGQHVSVTNLNDRFEFDTAWSYDEAALALAQHLSILFQYLDTLQPEAYSNDEEGENSEKKIPRAILRSWCKNKFIMEAPPPPPKQDIDSDANKPGPSGSGEEDSDSPAVESIKQIPQRKRIKTRLMTGSIALVPALNLLAGHGSDSGDPIIVDSNESDENNVSDWAVDYSVQSLSPPPSTQVPVTSNNASTQSPSPFTNDINTINGLFSFGLDLDLVENPWSKSRTYELD
ncbi:hypothetical protein BJ912DRAFT_1055479 [Pholiota molesta]|nr:hypothetical protein BJ912DRAFT_1055479 [Pholiota molesta]